MNSRYAPRGAGPVVRTQVPGRATIDRVDGKGPAARATCGRSGARHADGRRDPEAFPGSAIETRGER